MTFDQTSTAGIYPYNGTWANLPGDKFAKLNFNILKAPQMSENLFSMMQTEVSCVPSSADYEVTNKYDNNFQFLRFEINNIQPLANLNGVCWPSVSSPFIGDDTPICVKNTTGQIKSYLEYSNLMALFIAMALPLSGQYGTGLENVGGKSANIDGVDWLDAEFVLES